MPNKIRYAAKTAMSLASLTRAIPISGKNGNVPHTGPSTNHSPGKNGKEAKLGERSHSRTAAKTATSFAPLTGVIPSSGKNGNIERLF